MLLFFTYVAENDFDYERYHTDRIYREKIDAGTLEQQLHSLMSSILQESILESGVSRQTIEMKKHSTTIDTPNREIYAGCPFCDYQSEFHYNLGRHLRDEHLGKAVKKFSEMIDSFITHPERLFDLETQKYGYDVKQCPFCGYYYKAHETRKIREHVKNVHGELVSLLYELMRENDE